MKSIFLVITILVSTNLNAQTLEQIDSLRNQIVSNINQFESFRYTNKVISNEDAIRYDTICFYVYENELVYINKKETSHTFHISGDAIDFTELILLDEKVVFRRNYGYQFINPQWHLVPNINNSKVKVTESFRKYFSVDGSALMEYKGRESQGLYEDRFSLLDSLPLIEVDSFIWSERCEDCIQEEYISLYNKVAK